MEIVEASILHEEGLLTGVLSYPERFSRLVRKGFASGLFSDEANRGVAEAIETAFERFDEISDEKVGAVLMESHSGAVFDRFVSVCQRQRQYPDKHLEALLDAYRARSLSKSLSRVGPAPQRNESSRDWLDRALPLLREAVIASAPQTFSVFDSADQAVLADSEENFVPTGYSRLDRRIGGLPAGRVTVLGGRPSHGKTAFCLDLAERMSSGGPVLYFSAELSAKAVARRRKKRYLARGIEAYHEAMVEHPIFVDERARPTTQHMLSTALSYHSRTPLSLIIFDYLSYSGETHVNESLRLQIALQGSHETAKVVGCPFVVVSQLNRNIESRDADAEPQLSDLRWSGASEQMAGLVLMIHCPWVRWYQRGRSGNEPDERELMLFVRKNAEGPLGAVRLTFDRRSGLIYDDQ